MKEQISGLSVKNLHKFFGDTSALSGVSFEVTKGEIVAVLGPSGCGKSTLLNLIAGLEKPDAGQISWNGIPQLDIPTHQRGFGLMFQDYMLFPHKNVGSNVSFGLEMANWPKEKIEQRVRDVLNTVGLTDYALRDVNTLSGGEQQRVALARSLAPHPNLLMLDEPLGALDRALRERLLGELRYILRSMDQTALYVTHDQEEAFSLADRVVVMNKGKVAQIGTPQEIYRRPVSEFVARFLGFKNILDGEIKDNVLFSKLGALEMGNWAIETETPFPLSAHITILLRPDRVRLDHKGSHPIKGTVRGLTFHGSLCRVIVDIVNTTLTFEFPSSASLPEVGEMIRLSFNPEESLQVLYENNHH